MKLFKNIFNDPSQITKVVTGDPFEFKAAQGQINNGTLQVDITQSLRKIDKTKGTTFTYETNFYKSSKQVNYPLVLTKKLKNLQHPALPKIYEIKENGSKVIITTEEMYPLTEKIYEIRKIPDLLIWAVLNLVRGVDYLHAKGYLHGNIKPQSLYVTKALEVKVWGLEYLTELSSLKNSPFENRLQTDPQILDDLYLPPDPMNYHVNPAGVDSWGVAATLCYLFGTTPNKKSVVAQSPSIPMELVNYHKSINSLNHSERKSVSTILKEPIISQNRFLGIINVLEKFATVDAHQRDNFLRNLGANYDSFPPTFRQFKLMESFLEIMKSGRSEATSIVEPTMKLTQNLTQEDFDSDVLPTIKQLLQNGTPAIKSQLLAQAQLYVNKLPENIVAGYLYPMLEKSMGKESTGQMKDAAVRSLVCLAPKLPESTVNGEIVTFLDNCLSDKESIVKINTVVCIGKIANRFNHSNKATLVTKAFTSAMSENVADMKKAAYLMVSQNKYILEPQAVARQICPYIAKALCDLDPQIRKAAIECWDVISVTAREYAYTIDNPSYVPKYPQAGQEIHVGVNGSSTPMNTSLPLFGGQQTTFTSQSEYKESQQSKPVEKTTQTTQPVQEEIKPKQTQQKPQPTQQAKPKPAIQADDWDSWAASFEQQTKTRQPQIAYGNYTSTPATQPKPQPKPQPKKQQSGGWGFDFDSDFGGGSSSNVPSFI